MLIVVTVAVGGGAVTTHLFNVVKCLLLGMNKIQYIESSTKPFSVELESLILIVFFFFFIFG